MHGVAVRVFCYIVNNCFIELKQGLVDIQLLTSWLFWGCSVVNKDFFPQDALAVLYECVSSVLL